MRNEDLVLNNMKLAYSTAWKMRDTGIEMDDLQSLALLGLVKAARDYDENEGTNFQISRLQSCGMRFCMKSAGRENNEIRYHSIAQL